MGFLRKLCLGGLGEDGEGLEPGRAGADGPFSIERRVPLYETLNEFTQMQIIGRACH